MLEVVPRGLLKVVRQGQGLGVAVQVAVEGNAHWGAVGAEAVGEDHSGVTGEICAEEIVAAEGRADVDVDTLVIRNITADQGPTLKRFRARARGRGSRILKKTAHITVTLAEGSHQ